MDEKKLNVRGTFLTRVSRRTIYMFVLTALVATAAAGLLLTPETGVVSASQPAAQKAGGEVATAEMLAYALNFRAASGYTVFAGNGIADDGKSSINGTSGDALRGGAVAKDKQSVSEAIDRLMGLPCSEVEDTNLGGKSFAPGVYCLSSADLRGNVVLDAANDNAGVFIFRIAGSLNATKGGVSLVNGALGGNVFFVAGDSAVVGGEFDANVLARNNVNFEAGSTLNGKVFSLGKVSLNESRVAGGTTGTLQICKAITSSESQPAGFATSTFFFTVTGLTNPDGSLQVIPVVAGTCSGQLDVQQGTQTITELNRRTLLNSTTNIFNDFQLIRVDRLTDNETAPPSPSSLGNVNLAQRTAVVNIVAGDAGSQIALRFTNQFGITGTIQICKEADDIPFDPRDRVVTPARPSGNDTGSGVADPDVTGIFNFIVEGVFDTTPAGVRSSRVFPVLVGQCSEPIAVPILNPASSTASNVRVTELGRTGFFLNSVDTIPVDREVGTEVLGIGINAFGSPFPNPGGGFATVRVVRTPTDGTTANEVLVIFRNLTNPGVVKICKIAGPGIPENTIFRFTVVGFGATNANPPQTTTTIGNFVGTNPGNAIVTRTVDVRAGSPASGGTCQFVPGFGSGVGTARNEFQTFVNGTTVVVTELGISPVNDVLPQPSGEVRTSRIRSTSGFTSGPFSPNPDLTPGGGVGAGSFTSGNIAVPIPDLGTVSVPVNVPAGGLVSDVNVKVRLNHPFDADLVLTAIAPDGTEVLLSLNRGGAGDNYGSGANDCSGTPTVFDDSAATAIASGAAPFAGSFRPEVPLAAFNGRAVNGVWQLRVADTATLDVGIIGCVTFDFQIGVERISRAAVPARRGVVEVEFTNFRFNPAILKICKDVASPSLVGRPFTFDIALVSPTSTLPGGGTSPLFPAFSTTIDVVPLGVGIPGCEVVTDTAGLLGGQFNQGSTITITERTTSGPATVVSSVTSSSSGSLTPAGLIFVPGSRTGTLTGVNGIRPGINTVTFLNTAIGIQDRQQIARYDFDGDGKSDPSIFTPTNGNWTYAASSLGGDNRAFPFGEATDKLVPADYNGDGKTDYAVFRASTGTWYVHTSNAYYSAQWGQAGDIPQAGDFDGDGKADFVVFRPSNGTWYMRNSRDGFLIFQFGIPTDKPYAADYDGDGKTDAAVFRNGTWYTLGAEGFRIKQFGQAGDVPVPADYDGDGKADTAVYRSGTWYILTATRYSVSQLGLATDTPVPADYDGDGKTDLSVFRPSEGMWYILKSGQGADNAAMVTVSLGSASDLPIPSL